MCISAICAVYLLPWHVNVFLPVISRGVRSHQIFILPGRPTFLRSGEDRVFAVACFRLQ